MNFKQLLTNIECLRAYNGLKLNTPIQKQKKTKKKMLISRKLFNK